MLTRTQVRLWIANIVGCDTILVPTKDAELDYILALEGDYQELEVWQAALAVMIQQKKPEAAIANLSSLIKQKSDILIKNEQVKPYKAIETIDFLNDVNLGYGFTDVLKPKNKPATHSQYSDYTSFSDLTNLTNLMTKMTKNQPPPVENLENLENLASKPVPIEAQPECKGRKFR